MTLLRARSLVDLGLERTSVRESLLHSLLDEGIARSRSSLQRLLELHWPRLASIQGFLPLLSIPFAFELDSASSSSLCVF